MHEIVCLMVNGAQMTSSVREELLVVARRMILRGKKSERIKSEECEGRISTEFEPALFGSFYGLQFGANIESKAGKTEIKFLLHPAAAGVSEVDIRDGEWIPLQPSRAQRAAYN